MILKLEEKLSQKEVEVLIRYAHLDPVVKKLAALVKSVDKTIPCRIEQNEKRIHASDIYYIESVDKRTYVYCKEDVYQTDLRLYQLLEELADMGFVQVSKSCIINILMLDHIRPLFNSRMEATLMNQERISVTRKYIPLIRAKLEEIC